MIINILIGVVLDLLIGDPYNFPHPIRYMGNLINFEEKLARKYFKNNLKGAGLLIALFNIFFLYFGIYHILFFLEKWAIVHRIISIYIIYTSLAAKSLSLEAKKVKKALSNSLEEGRYRLSYIVGRETKYLSEEEIIKATVETVSENTSDGVIAPLFYIFLLGPAGGFMYKIVNTMDSMLGYKNEKYIDLGRYPAIIDDIYNFIPARITGVLMCISSIGTYDVRNGFKVLLKDAKEHESPNAGWPEGAVAGLLQIQLGGNGIYSGKVVKKATLGTPLKEVERKDIIDAIKIMYRTELIFIILFVFTYIILLNNFKGVLI